MRRVSIIVPVYNVEKYIEECLQSVANQTCASDIECVIVDDKGGDNSVFIVEQFVASYNGDVEFRLIRRKQNGGLSAARNTGIREAKGEYLYFLDSDDYLFSNAIETLLTLADKHGGVDLLPALYYRDDNSMNHFRKDAFPEFSDDRRLIKCALLDYDRIPVTAANRLIRREFLLQQNLYFKEGIIHEDNYWTFFLSKYVQRMAFCPEKIYYYRITEGSITRKVNIEKEFFAFKTMITDFSNNIDTFEVGAQKRLVFLNVLTMWRDKQYSTKKEAQELISIFLERNGLLEKILALLSIYFFPRTFVNDKIINLLQRVYMK